LHMKSPDFWRCAVGLGVAMALLAGCGGPQPLIGAPSVVPQSRIAARSHNDYDVTGPLLYVTEYGLAEAS
jgi:hypothetical protein